MSILCHWIDKDNQKTEFAVTLLKPLKDCTIHDFNQSAFAASYDQINNVAYTGPLPQKATADSINTVWFNTGNSIDFSTLHFSVKNDSQLYRRTLVLAVPQHTEISAITRQDINDNVYLVWEVQSLNKLVLVNSVQYRTDYLRTKLNFSQPLRHCLYGTTFDYDNAATLITDGIVNYQLIPVFMYIVNDHVFITQNDVYSTPYADCLNTICGFTDGIPCFDDPDIKLCLGVNPNDRPNAVTLSSGYYDNITNSVHGDMLNIYDCSSPVNADIKLSIYSEQDSPELMYLQRGVLLNIDCYTACASQYGFIFINNITNEVYEPALRDGIVEGYKELVNKPVKFRSLSNNNTQLRTVPPVSDVRVSNESEYYTVGIGINGRWQVRKYSINDTTNPEIVEDIGSASEILAAYLEADGDFDYFVGDSHISLVTSGMPWLVVIRASDKHMYVKKVLADVQSTAVLLDTDVEQASICRGWKSDKFDVDAGLIVAYRKRTGVYMRAYYKIEGQYVWDTVQILSGIAADRVEVKRLNDFRIGVYTYSGTYENQVWLSPRYYIGGTTKTEYLEPAITSDFSVFSFTAEDGPHDDLAIESVVLKNHREFWVKANYRFYWRDTSWNDILATSVPSGFTIESYWIEDGYLVIRMSQTYQSDYIHNEFRIKAMNRIRFYRTEQSIPICPQIDIIYDKPAEGFTTENLNVAITGSWNFVMKPQETLTGYHTETLNTNISGMISINMLPAVDVPGYHTETLNVSITNASVTIVVEQTGVTPV